LTFKSSVTLFIASVNQSWSLVPLRTIGGTMELVDQAGDCNYEAVLSVVSR